MLHLLGRVNRQRAGHDGNVVVVRNVRAVVQDYHIGRVHGVVACIFARLADHLGGCLVRALQAFHRVSEFRIVRAVVFGGASDLHGGRGFQNLEFHILGALIAADAFHRGRGRASAGVVRIGNREIGVLHELLAADFDGHNRLKCRTRVRCSLHRNVRVVNGRALDRGELGLAQRAVVAAGARDNGGVFARRDDRVHDLAVGVHNLHHVVHVLDQLGAVGVLNRNRRTRAGAVARNGHVGDAAVFKALDRRALDGSRANLEAGGQRADIGAGAGNGNGRRARCLVVLVGHRVVRAGRQDGLARGHRELGLGRSAGIGHVVDGAYGEAGLLQVGRCQVLPLQHRVAARVELVGVAQVGHELGRLHVFLGLGHGVSARSVLHRRAFQEVVVRARAVGGCARRHGVDVGVVVIACRIAVLHDRAVLAGAYEQRLVRVALPALRALQVRVRHHVAAVNQAVAGISRKSRYVLRHAGHVDDYVALYIAPDKIRVTGGRAERTGVIQAAGCWTHEIDIQADVLHAYPAVAVAIRAGDERGAVDVAYAQIALQHEVLDSRSVRHATEQRTVMTTVVVRRSGEGIEPAYRMALAIERAAELNRAVAAGIADGNPLARAVQVGRQVDVVFERGDLALERVAGVNGIAEGHKVLGRADDYVGVHHDERTIAGDACRLRAFIRVGGNAVVVGVGVLVGYRHHVGTRRAHDERVGAGVCHAGVV